MIEQRLRFSKTGRAIYISHLDLMRTFQRAFMRAGIKVKHTEGYNPHAYVSVALPLSVGVSSHCEILDFGLRDDIPLDQLPELMNKALPEGITVTSAYNGGQKVGKLKYVKCEITMEYDNGVPAGTAAALDKLFAAKELVIEKKTKKGMGMSDIKEGIHRISFEEHKGIVTASCVLSAQNPAVSPDNIVSAIRQKASEYAPDFASALRIETFDENMEIFR